MVHNGVAIFSLLYTHFESSVLIVVTYDPASFHLCALAHSACTCALFSSNHGVAALVG
jgi:hypothetical protein